MLMTQGKWKRHVIAVPTRVRVCGFKRKQSIIIMKKKVSTMYDNYFIIKVFFSFGVIMASINKYRDS